MKLKNVQQMLISSERLNCLRTFDIQDSFVDGLMGFIVKLQLSLRAYELMHRDAVNRGVVSSMDEWLQEAWNEINGRHDDVID